MRPTRHWVAPSEDEIRRAEVFVRAHALSAEPLLVGGGDKAIWFYDPGDTSPAGPSGLVLYQRRGDRLFVFRDPVVAVQTDPPTVIDAFLRFADELDVEVVFTMISPEWRSRLHDFGFHFIKVSEEAIVPLSGFTLRGSRHAGFRRTIRDMERAGIRFGILDPPFEPSTIDALRAVSDAWLAAKGGHELQFSACYFSAAYLQRNPIGAARDRADRIVAFVNILTTRAGGPATHDFMRYTPGLADNLMDFVIVRTMEVLAEQGFASFSLGTAPLSALGVFRGSRLAERLLHLFSLKAEHLYNYRGLLRYKSKFHPRWEPRFLAFRQPWGWAASLVASARLVGARRRTDRARIAAARVRDGV